MRDLNYITRHFCRNPRDTEMPWCPCLPWLLHYQLQDLPSCSLPRGCVPCIKSRKQELLQVASSYVQWVTTHTFNSFHHSGETSRLSSTRANILPDAQEGSVVLTAEDTDRGLQSKDAVVTTITKYLNSQHKEPFHLHVLSRRSSASSRRLCTH